MENTRDNIIAMLPENAEALLQRLREKGADRERTGRAGRARSAARGPTPIRRLRAARRTADPARVEPPRS